MNGFVLLPPELIPGLLHWPQKHIDNESNGAAQNKGGENGKQGRAQGCDLAGVVQAPVEQQGEGDDAQDAFQGVFVLVHAGWPPFQEGNDKRSISDSPKDINRYFVKGVKNKNSEAVKLRSLVREAGLEPARA